MNFCFGAMLKTLRYREKIQNLDHLITRIAAAVSSVTPLVVTPYILQRTFTEVDFRLKVCRANGAHIHSQLPLLFQTKGFSFQTQS